ncbi:hypothetical protein POM88_032184 [Heracleum sosnowskyi]|uniref:Uncharacterized protein n=1 Tax=Heracleum sosnowskyi TaxID=360622 RepID=A0AAD8MJT7_9APIA|nr:hypothetical protein POM88_032184 [Heracleum sosnowskyi]
MAFCLHSAFLSSEYNNMCSTTLSTSNGRWFPGRRMDGYNGGLVMVKLWSSCKRATYNQILRNSRLYCGLDSRFLDVLANGRSKIFSLCNIDAVMKSKDRFNLETTIKLIAQRQWNQFAAAALVLACIQTEKDPGDVPGNDLPDLPVTRVQVMSREMACL